MPRLSNAQVFGARFLFFLVVASVLTWATNLPNRLAVIQAWLARAASWLASLVGSGSRVLGDQILADDLTIHINYECTGAYVIIVLVTFLAAYPASWRERVAGVAIGVAALTLVNAVRIAALVRVAELRPDLFVHFHEYVWQGVFLVLVVAYAMSWVERVR